MSDESIKFNSAHSSSVEILTESCSIPQKDDNMAGIPEGRGEQLMELEESYVEQFLSDHADDDSRIVENRSITKCSEEQASSLCPPLLDLQGSRHRVSGSVVSDDFLTCSSDESLTDGGSPRNLSESSTFFPVLVFNKGVGPSTSKAHEKNTGASSSDAHEMDVEPFNLNVHRRAVGPSTSSPHERDAEPFTSNAHERDVGPSTFNAHDREIEPCNDNLPSRGFSDADEISTQLSQDLRDLRAHSSQEDLPIGSFSGRSSLPQKRDKSGMVAFKVFFITPRSVDKVELHFEEGVHHEEAIAAFPLGKGIDGKLRAWCWRAEGRLSSREKICAKYITWSEDVDHPISRLPKFGLVSSIKNHMLEALSERTLDVRSHRVSFPRRRVLVDVCDDLGLLKSPTDYTLVEWLAVLRTLIACTGEFSSQDTLAEYFHKRPNQPGRMFVSRKQHPSESLKDVLRWVSHLQEEFDKESSSRLQEQSHGRLIAKQGLVSVALLEICVALRNLPRDLAIKEWDLAKAFLEILVLLESFFRGLRPDSPFLQEAARNILQAAMGHLVSCVSPFTFEWIKHLDVLGFFDPTLEFMNGWSPFRFEDMSNREVEKTREQYLYSTRELCRSGLFNTPSERLTASGSALKAAPTIREFFQAARRLEKQGWLLCKGSSESAADHMHLLDEALHRCFSKFKERHENSSGRKMRIHRQLEFALNVEQKDIHPFLAPSFRDHLTDLFEEILDLEDHSQGVMNTDNILSLVKSRSTITDVILSLVTSPHAFTIPLSSSEVRVTMVLSTTPNSKTYASGRDALVYLANREISHTEYQEVLKVWIQGAAKRKVSAGGFDGSVYLPPHSFLAALEELLSAGVGSSFSSSLAQMAMSMAVEECPNLPAFLQDAKKISQSQSKVLQDHYLNAAGGLMEAVLGAPEKKSQLDETASASLRAICQHTNRGMLQFQNSIGERLCAILLDTAIKARSDLQDDLRQRPIETIAESKLASLLMQIEKCPQSIKSHLLYKEIHKACLSLGGSLQSGSVSLRYINLSTVTGDWEKIFQAIGNASSVAALEKAHKDLLVYKKQLEGFEVLVYKICPFLIDNNIAIEEYVKWRDWALRRRSEWEDFTLSEIHSSLQHWPSEVHKAIYEYLDPLINLHESRIFGNVLLESILSHGVGNNGLVRRTPSAENQEEIFEISLSTVSCVMLPQAVNQYMDEMRLFVATDINFDKILMERICILLNGVDPNSVEKEFEFARRQLGWDSTKTHNILKCLPDKQKNIVEYLHSWKGTNVLRELHSILPLVASVFDLNKDCDGLVLRIWNVITECTPQCSLRRFQEVLQKDGKNVLTRFSASEVDTLKELTTTGLLIMFLRETVQEDLRHLLDAVEDPNSTRSWEGLINDLIDLQRIFRPILSAKTASFEELCAAIVGELKSSSSSSNHLCRKLKACNKEAHNIRQYFLGVANRTFKDNDQIAGILKSGTYHFSLSEDECLLELKCSDAGPVPSETSESFIMTKPPASSGGAKSYTLAQLQELRSRARWTISSNTYVKKSKTAQAFGADWAGTDAETIETTEKSAVKFINHIDIAEQLVATLSELHNCGHFSYATFQKVVPSFADLQILTDRLKIQLLAWKAALLRARKDFLCLNFFRSIELRLILEVLMLETPVQPTKKVEHCLDLFKWTGIFPIDLNAVREMATRNLVPSLVTQIAELRQDGKEGLIYSCLRVFSSVIESFIFQKKLEKNFDARSASDMFKGRQGIILADVDDPQSELDVVATLFSERNLSLHGNASNVILCGPLTAWEDIYLLILRYLNNLRRKDFFYCVAYVERLSFDCQAQLLILLQEFAHENQTDENELALVSCSRGKFLHTLSQRLQIQVRHMAVGRSDVIGVGKEGKYSGMWVITSDLPGMGKTKFVQNVAQFNHNKSIRTLTIGGEVSRNLLIERLKTLFTESSTQPSSIFLHLDISVVGNPETLNDLLFELLVLGCLKSDRAGLFHLETQKVVIEVANTFHNYLASKLPVCKWFRTEHLVWNMANFEASSSVSSDDQFVCNYLHQLQAGNLDKWNPDGQSSDRNIVPISNEQCRVLLQRYFVDWLKDSRSISLTLMETFIKFFAQQLRGLSECPFLVPEQLTHMRASPDTRPALVRSILEVSRELSMRSVKPWLDEQQELTTSVNAEILMTARMDNMQRWSDTKNVMIFFQIKGRIAVLYRDLSHVPTSLIDLFHSQKAKLPHYESLKSEELFEELWPILHRTRPPARDNLYVLTADNFLKMALIFTKVKADVPVVIMGETGCGKTSLLRQLAHYCCVAFLSITLHAGTTEDEIRMFLSEAEKQASNDVVWAFLDEINACEHLGFLVGVVCHHLLDGRPLHHNIKVLAACNPYRKHDSKKQRAGLSAREMLKSSNVEHLDKAYTVHPLPEALVENVQDFGILNVNDERSYIQAMVLRSTRHKAMSFPFIKLIVISQAFVKEKCGEASVSLRDARRCIDLFIFFNQDLESRPQSTTLSAECREKRAALLSFAHCYYYRLSTDKERTEYKAKYVATMNGNSWRKKLTLGSYTEKRFEKELLEEQMNLLDHMEIPPGIAKNQALRENVFVTLTCILQRIPLFVVGKPGSGKTLSLQLIFSNLRGSGMKDPYFRQKPTMFMFSYQGSESSTSEGILKVFEKAYRCVEDNKKKNVKAVVVVVLDEVGLAEISSHNPLKVLHSLLEPDGDQQIAVVGISNWSLDAAKMNRAIHISQPDPSVTDLVATGEAILDSYGMRKIYGEEQMTEMKWLAKIYHEYHVRQSKPDFHGLRDFYSLVKSLRGDEKNPKKWTPDDLKRAVWRNFGGSPNDIDLLVSILGLYFKKLRFEAPPALDLVKANLDDKDARHLMLISTGESGIGIVENMLPQKEKLIIVHGSNYKDDCSDDYSYLMLSNIILHMEHGRHILLKGVERVWSSLYDMLNQHYTIVGGRRNCRIAIGAFSNPMCYVHDNFRCIVAVDQNQVQSLDPPFLNRFEKQVLNWEAMLTLQQRKGVEVLKKWVKAMACTSEDDYDVDDPSFYESDLFAGYSADTLASLVLVNWGTQSKSSNSFFLERCKGELLQTAYPDGIMRAHYSRTCLQDAPDAKTWTSKYFQKRSDQESLVYMICHHIGDRDFWQDNLGFKLVLTTRSNVHTDISFLLKDLNHVKVQIIKLGDFTAERQLIATIQHWSKSINDLLIIQSDSVLDKYHLPLAKVHVERIRADLLAQAQSHPTARHVVFILHSHRGEHEASSSFSFLSGWKQITLDQLQQEDADYREYLDKSIAELVQSERFREGQNLMGKVLTWSFLCIKYPRGKQSASYCQEMVQKICNDKDLCDCLIRRAVIWLEKEAKKELEAGKVWQTAVVCNRGRLALASNLHYAFLQYIEEKLREPIARLIYVLESKSALGSYFNMTHTQKDMWRRVFMDRQTISIKNVPQPMHPEGYTIKDPMYLNLPFSSLYAEHIDKHMRELYLTRVSGLRSDDAGALSLAVGMARDVSVSFLNNASMQLIEECVIASPDDYCHDFAVLYAPYQSEMRTASQALVFEWLLREKVPDLRPLMLHALVWTKLETLKAQAVLASSCYTSSEVSTEVNVLKRTNVFVENFDDRFASKCVLKMLPSQQVIEKAGGVHNWLHHFDILIKLVSNVSVGGAFHASIMLTLHVLQDFARLVVCPDLPIAAEDLYSLSHWFVNQRPSLRPSSESLISKIISLLPDINGLRGLDREMYFRFVASTFSRLLESKSVPRDVISTMSTVVFHFKAPTCLMKGVMNSFIHAVVELLIPEPSSDCPPLLQLSLVKSRNVIKEQNWASESYEPFILLSDIIYDSVRAFVTPELMSGEDTEAFSFENFLKCLRFMAIKVTLPSGTLNLSAACSFALLRCVMEVLARDLVTIQKKDPGVFKPRLAPPITKILTNFFAQSHDNVLALKQYLMKVLRYHCGLSIQVISYLAHECRKNSSFELYSFILDWDMLKEVDNPLGFNPFTSLFSSYEKADDLLWSTIYSEGEKLQRLKLQIQNLSLTEQGALTSAVASKIFLVQALRKLSEKEEEVANWLQEEGIVQQWDRKWQLAVRCLAGTGPLQLSSVSTTSEGLQFKALAAHILLVVSTFSSDSPLQGYMALEERYVVKGFVLAIPDNLLASLRGALTNKERFGEYKHDCGFVYVIGNCTEPNQKAKCPGCGGTIGGDFHKLSSGNSRMTGAAIEKGYIPDHVARSDMYYTVRGLEIKSFRVIRLVIHYCILLGLYMGRSGKEIAKLLNMTELSVIKEVETMIEGDLVMLGTLLNCNREVTCQFVHSIVASMAKTPPQDTLLMNPEARSTWEKQFQHLVKALSDRNVHKGAADYIEKHRGKHEMTELLEERRASPFPAATATFTRISVVPDFKNFQAMYMQDETRRRNYPIVERFFVHMEQLSDMKHLLPLVRFSKAIHEQLSSKITRPEAASISVREYLSSLTDKDRYAQECFQEFASSWNVMRLKVTAFECTEFKQGIPEMNGDANIGFCLVESRDLGIYLAALLDHLRNIQNTFLDEVAEFAAPAPNPGTVVRSSHLSVKVQMCKAEEVVSFDDNWPQSTVYHAAMANLEYGQGLNPIYDDYTIAQCLQNRLVDQRPHLDVWEPFLYKHEAFHKHMTILSDVANLVNQIPLGPEILQGIQSEIELGVVGAGRYLATLDLCLGFLRRTGGDLTERLGSYCQRWLGDEAFLITRMNTLYKLQLQHIVSLYEGLEDSASVDIQGLVNIRYRTPLSSDLIEELRSSVEVKRIWRHTGTEDATPKISAELFHSVLRRFMFRHMIGDQLNAEVPLSIYITDPRLMKWPDDVVDDVDDVFPPSLLVHHSHATYLYLSEMLKVGNAK